MSHPKWMDDSASPWCLLCRAPFTTFNRRHHCRECFTLVCSACSSRSLVLENADDNKAPQRVCDNCYSSLISASAQQGATEDAGSTVLFQLRVVGRRRLVASAPGRLADLPQGE